MALSLFMGGPLPAQTPMATLSGAVRDTSGTIVPNAKISVKNTATGKAAEATSDAAGAYTVPNLAPGNYEVSVSAEGFVTKTSTLAMALGAKQTMEMFLASASGNAVRPSLGDLGFPPELAQEAPRTKRGSTSGRTCSRHTSGWA